MNGISHRPFEGFFSVLLGWSLLSATVFVAPAISHAFECVPSIRGDANADGDLDIADSTAILFHLFLGSPEFPECGDAFDFDDSGVLDISDPLASLSYLFLGVAPPVNVGQCAADVTEDALFCDHFEPCGPEVEQQNFSDFTEFEFSVGPALGFCPQIGEVIEARIERILEGFLVTGATVALGNVETDDCLPFSSEFIGGGNCLVAVESSGRLLVEEDAALIVETFGSPRTIDAPAAICECVAIDPCLISSFSWDGEVFSDFICTSRRLADGEARRLLTAMQGLVTGE
jgi:hypothetical protein